MPAPQRYPSVYQQLFLLARQAKEGGVGFDDFWTRAVYGAEPGWELDEDERPYPRTVWKQRDPRAPKDVILWPRFDKDRLPLLETLEETRSGWLRAYEDIPARPREEALTRLAPDGSRDIPDAVPETGIALGGAVA